MTARFKCDSCQKDFLPHAVYGGDVKGGPRVMNWVREGNKMGLALLPTFPNSDPADSHACVKCMRGMVLEMSVELFGFNNPDIHGIPMMGRHRDGIYYPHFPGLACLDPEHCTLMEKLQEDILAQDIPRDQGPDRDVPEVRAEPAVPEPGADQPEPQPAPTHRCSSCHNPLYLPAPTTGCDTPALHYT